MVERGVWYVAYGSNLSSMRLQRYLDRCDDPSRPMAARPGTLPHRLFFAHESKTWTGGTAFVDPMTDPLAGTLTVAWLVTADQFLHVLARENAQPSVDATLPDLPAVGRSIPVVEGRYGLVLGVESPDDRPAFTFTTGESPRPVPRPPASAYVETIVAGLMDHHGHSDRSARAYLAVRGGSAEVGVVSDAGEEVAQCLEGSTAVEQRPDVTAEAELPTDEGVESGT